MPEPSARFPGFPVPTGHVEPVPRRIRGRIDGRTVFDTRHARYVWEWPPYPQYSVPVTDIAQGALVDEGIVDDLAPGPARRYSLSWGSETRPGAAWLWEAGAPEALHGTVRFRWDALDAWYEEDERVFVHPRSPYVRVDAVRSATAVRVEAAGTVLADAPSCVMVFETGLPTRYYLDPVYVDWTLLRPTRTETACPYKGTTSGYWSFTDADGTSHDDILWAYDFPTTALAPISRMVAFYNERTTVFLDDVLQPRP
ncbi:DUF427 domain-containing protein [Streptomyces sp. NPDC050560]|uniref:DUF427 domain-containing protein n=1 Tax=Streptomyces sp. NPDC050560 TaxID=3365630 RepID=UPI00379FAEEB